MLVRVPSPAALLPQPDVLVPETLAVTPGDTLLLLQDRYFGNPVVRWNVRMHTPAIRYAARATPR